MHKSQSRGLSGLGPQLIAWGLVLVYVVTFTWLAILRHASFNSAGFDLGIYDQVVWNTLHGRIFFYTTTGLPLLHLSNHADPILLLVAPFYLIYSGPEMLLFLQAAVIGLGGLPLFWLAREKLESDLAGISLLLAYLLFPALQIIPLWDFHPPALATGFLMYAFYFMVKRRPAWFFLFAVLAMACKEQIPLLVIFMGLYAILCIRDWRLGVPAVALGAAWFVVVMYWVIPAYSVEQRSLFLGYYSDLGDSPLAIVTGALTRPDMVLRTLGQPPQLGYLRDILTPFAYLPLLGLPVFLIGLPSLAINLLSSNPAMHDATGGQYAADVAPWLAWGAVYGMYYLRQGLEWGISKVVRGRGDRPVAPTTGVLSLCLLAVSLTWQVFRGYSPLALDPPHWEITDHNRLAQHFIAQIPPDASLSAQGKLYPHLSNRVIAYQFPDVNDAEYVFLDVTAGTWPIHPNDLKARAQALLDSRQFGMLDAADGYILLRRGLPSGTLPDAFYDFARVTDPHPQYPLNVEFGDELRLVGFDLTDDPRREEVSVRFYWQALRPIDHDLRLYPFFVDPEGQVVEDTQQRPLITQLWYPPRLWRPGETVVAETLPWQVGDRWSLAVGVLAGPDWSDWSQRLRAHGVESPKPLRRFEATTWVRMATFERQGRRLVEIAPVEGDLQPANAVRANLDGKMELRGYDISPPVGQAGQELAVTLYWHSLAPMSLDYTVFVHLIGPDGQRVAQHDGQPWWEVPLPTSTWQPGEDLRDRHNLKLPPDLAPGSYRLQVGVYYWQTQERLPVIEGNTPVNNYVELGSITVR